MKTSVLSYNQKCRKVLADKRILSYLIKITILFFSHLSIDEIETLIEEDVLVKAKMHILFAKRNEIVMESERKGKRKEQIKSVKSIMETMNVSYEEATRLLKLNKKEIH